MRVPDFASYWARNVGARVDSLRRLSGGINNNVFICRSENKKWVIKGYPPANTDYPDRMQAEVDFLEYSSRVAQCYTPALIEVDTQRRCTVIEHISGRSYSEGITPSQYEIQEAFWFYNRLNSDLNLGKRMIRLDAAEGFLKLSQHMENVLTRIVNMGTEHLPNRYKNESREILCELRSQSERMAIRLQKEIYSGTIEDAISSDERCISPSDFGFHNAILTGKGVVFLDFEFAGWDDPAKLCVDFTLQPRNPVKLRPMEVASILFPDKAEQMSRRINVLTEILTLKWFCIILSILNKERLASLITHSEQDPGVSVDLLISRQLKRYIVYSKAYWQG